jgi:hypothetical protein
MSSSFPVSKLTTLPFADLTSFVDSFCPPGFSAAASAAAASASNNNGNAASAAPSGSRLTPGAVADIARDLPLILDRVRRAVHSVATTSPLSSAEAAGAAALLRLVSTALVASASQQQQQDGSALTVHGRFLENDCQIFKSFQSGILQPLLRNVPACGALEPCISLFLTQQRYQRTATTTTTATTTMCTFGSFSLARQAALQLLYSMADMPELKEPIASIFFEDLFRYIGSQPAPFESVAYAASNAGGSGGGGGANRASTMLPPFEEDDYLSRRTAASQTRPTSLGSSASLMASLTKPPPKPQQAHHLFIYDAGDDSYMRWFADDSTRKPCLNPLVV